MAVDTEISSPAPSTIHGRPRDSRRTSARPPLIGSGDPESFADPLPQSLVLTAIVISFGVTALLLALAYRSWLLTRDDEVQDDVEDRNVGQDSPDTEVDA